MSQLETRILHQEYLLTCPDGQEAQLMEAVERVEQQFQQMCDTTKLRSRERIGVLLAVNLAFENLELRNQLQTLQQQLAVQQGQVDTTQADLDAERLFVLETQAAHDQTVAHDLLARLDQFLQSTEPSAPSHASASESPPNETVLSPSTISPQGAASADVDNAEDVDLASTTAENR